MKTLYLYYYLFSLFNKIIYNGSDTENNKLSNSKRLRLCARLKITQHHCFLSLRWKNEELIAISKNNIQKHSRFQKKKIRRFQTLSEIVSNA